MIKNNLRIGIIGLGYVGLPLAVEFGKYFPTIGFDVSTVRIKEIIRGDDSTLEVSNKELISIQSDQRKHGLNITNE